MTSDRRFRFDPTEAYQPKITHRPLKSESQITRDTIEENFHRDQIKLNRRLAKFKINANKQHHNSRPLERGNTFWDDGKIVDRGRGRPVSAQFILEPQSEVQSIRRKKYIPVPGNLGDHNPISDPWNGHWMNIKDPIISRSASLVAYSPTKSSRNGCYQYGNYDPIKCNWIIDPNNQDRKNNTGFVKFKRRPRSCYGVKERHPFVHEKLYEDEFVKREKRSTARPRDQGVYDPVKNSWLVLPENKRICEGRSFAPVSSLQFR